MTADTEHWALLWDGDDTSRPRSVVRRRATPEGWAEEILRGDGAWHSAGIIALARLHMYEHDLQPISAADALDFERRVISRPAGQA